MGGAHGRAVVSVPHRTVEDVALASRQELNEGQREVPPRPVADEEPQHERAA
ncbi:hypothetical protein QZH56_21330 [Streptomyces olivoreticuli]|uniref:hypothetical protein n=1 Tax=Streptomyces olivoreticuli TaxID=68246 RepID=UPI00265A70EF|nr:hypothetical protein [Streptomyces olivoreticuli]WKK21398.1 hypothetical protein QZH56_21330 [Streptomyces olivoreticuli]